MPKYIILSKKSIGDKIHWRDEVSEEEALIQLTKISKHQKNPILVEYKYIASGYEGNLEFSENKE